MRKVKLTGNYTRTKLFKEWFVSEDCYGNRMVADEELPAILKRLKGIGEINIVAGDIKKDQPNVILVNIDHIKGKDVWINLAHFIRPCVCEDCEEDYQYECYINNCKCCMDECT